MLAIKAPRVAPWSPHWSTLVGRAMCTKPLSVSPAPTADDPGAIADLITWHVPCESRSSQVLAFLIRRRPKSSRAGITWAWTMLTTVGHGWSTLVLRRYWRFADRLRSSFRWRLRASLRYAHPGPRLLRGPADRLCESTLLAPTAAQRHLNTLGAPLCHEHAEAAIADTYAAFA